MEGNVGVIVDYKYLAGSNVGKIYKRRFETVVAFAAWAAEYETSGLVKILSSKVVAPEKVYWEDRWIAKAN